MMIESPRKFEGFGSINIFDLIRVLEIDTLGYKGFGEVFTANKDLLIDYATRTAIVIPVKDEELLTLEGVISAIPHVSLVIVVSASSREPVDRYADEVDLVRSIHRNTRRGIIILHQQDPVWSEALRGTSLEPMISGGKVRSGKGEGMILGILTAAAFGYKYVGFIDSDNYVPGSAYEYAMIYYSGFLMSESKYAMIRIKWPYKGKLASSDIYLRKRGRVSSITESILNYALSLYRKYETDIIKTANSGEHALTIDLALKMKWSGGFAVEPYELVNLIEMCYLGLEDGDCPIISDKIKIYQIESRNPHIHAERGDEHIADMLNFSLGTIYHSKLGLDQVKERIRKALEEYGIRDEPPRPRIYDLSDLEPTKILEKIISTSNDIHYFEPK